MGATLRRQMVHAVSRFISLSGRLTSGKAFCPRPIPWPGAFCFSCLQNPLPQDFDNRFNLFFGRASRTPAHRLTVTRARHLLGSWHHRGCHFGRDGHIHPAPEHQFSLVYPGPFQAGEQLNRAVFAKAIKRSRFLGLLPYVLK